jgi:uncharacterized membrane protein (DUF2068 family)
VVLAEAVTRGRPQRAVKPRAGAQGRPDRGLLLIALFKMLKALLLVAGGLAALELLRPDAARSVNEWVAALPLDSQRRLAHRFLVRLTGLPAGRLHALGIAFFAYAGLFVVEGIGLWRQKRWAEYLTVIATSSFVPLEIYELAKDVTPPRIAALLANLFVVAYLGWVLRRGRGRTR